MRGFTCVRYSARRAFPANSELPSAHALITFETTRSARLTCASAFALALIVGQLHLYREAHC